MRSDKGWRADEAERHQKDDADGKRLCRGSEEAGVKSVEEGGGVVKCKAWKSSNKAGILHLVPDKWDAQGFPWKHQGYELVGLV